jgi:hypothetical protein
MISIGHGSSSLFREVATHVTFPIAGHQVASEAAGPFGGGSGTLSTMKRIDAEALRT